MNEVKEFKEKILSSLRIDLNFAEDVDRILQNARVRREAKAERALNKKAKEASYFYKDHAEADVDQEKEELRKKLKTDMGKYVHQDEVILAKILGLISSGLRVTFEPSNKSVICRIADFDGNEWFGHCQNGREAFNLAYESWITRP